MTLSALNKHSLLNIEAAGPRYSPIIDPNAPNLEIIPLVSAIETLSLTEKYRISINEIEINLTKEWKDSSVEIINLFPNKAPQKLIRHLRILKNQKPGTSKERLEIIKKSVESISKILQTETHRLWEVERTLKEHTEEWRTIQSLISRVRDLEKVIFPVLSLIRNKNFELIENNRLFFLGEWGSGKTHLLCDISKNRISRNLPTLFLLAHRLPQKVDPLTAVCQSTKLATTPKKLLKELNDLGKATKTRSLLIIDGINEADRAVWKKNIPKILSLIDSYKNVGLILSCRTPFDRFLLTKPYKNKFVNLFHSGFQEIEFDAQRVFFKYYKIPNPHIPLLTPEFSRPLFLKILCSTFSGQTSTTKSRWINEIASGQKSMTKLFEDFVCQIGLKIETNFGLAHKTCWKILKGAQASSGEVMGIAVSMANQIKDYIDPKESLRIIKELSGKTKAESHEIFKQMITEGLVVEDTIWDGLTQKNIIRLPYQRFSDHLISRHLLKEYLNVKSEGSIKNSFYKNRPLGKVFEIDKYGRSYNMPGLASAIMLEFPERVKNTLPAGERELIFYLPRKNRLVSPMVDAFLEGVLWRSKDSFSNHTGNIFAYLLDSKDEQIQSRTLECLVSLACRPNHPYSANRLYNHLIKQTLIERDLFWSEFLRNSYLESVIHRLLNWIEDSVKVPIDKDTAENLILLISLFLTTTDRPLRDRATKCLVIIGEKQPEALLKVTVNSLNFNDPYLPERMLAASYGVLMRSWSFPSEGLKNCIVSFCNNLYDSLFAVGAANTSTHILLRDYALGCIELSKRINNKCLSKRSLKNLKAPYQSPKVKIPNPRRITEAVSACAKPAIHMDFENYTVGRLVVGRRNYESEHTEYRKVLKQIKWRIVNLGYSEALFKNIDRSISERSFYRESRKDAGKVDRYGKKYSWIAYFEVAGLLLDQGLLPDRYTSRISDIDIDPSFPEQPKVWQPGLKRFFVKKSTTPM
ncbi:MAG: hypothetical protein JWQ09_2487, partial [Segetibacter sp.]|nr:hypothetical protein [Segetibacter sp.]